MAFKYRIIMKALKIIAIGLIISGIVFDYYLDVDANIPEVVGEEGYQMAPEFSLKSLSGEDFNLADQRGKIVMLNFWATWCGPCRWEIPMLNELYNSYKDDGVIVVGVAITSGSKDKIESFIKSYNVDYPILYGSDDDIARLVYAYGNFASIPSTFLINQKGEVTNYFVGAQEKEIFEGGIRNILDSNL